MVLLGACSSTEFVYNRLDFLIGWYADDYVELDRQQEALFDAELDDLLAWHRQTELPQYVDFLDRTVDKLDSEITEVDLDQLFEEVEAAADRIQERFLELMITVGNSLSLEQRQEFIEHLREEQADSEEEYLSRDEKQYREDAVDRFEDNFKDFLGKLNADQRDLIREGVADLIRLDTLWLEDRALWIDQLDSILTIEDPRWDEKVRVAYATRDETRLPEYAQGIETNTRVSRQVILQVINSRTAKQDKRLRKRIASYREDLEDLIAQR